MSEPSPPSAGFATPPEGAPPPADGWGGREVRRRGSAREVLRFVAGGLVAAVVIASGTFAVTLKVASAEAQHEAQTITATDARAVIAPLLTAGLVRRDGAALAALDDAVRTRVLDSRVRRVKVWDGDGTILYSDEPRYIGARFHLGDDEQEALRTGGTDSDISDLSAPENRFDRSNGQLLEVYLGVRTTTGHRLLFETYQNAGAIASDGRRLWGSFLPVLLVGFVLLLAVQVPLAWRLATRLERGRLEREALLRRVIEASEGERRRIAADLHDGVVQRLAATSFSLAAAGRRVRSSAQPEDVSAIDHAAAETRRAMRELRTLIVEIAPPSLDPEGLVEALEELLTPLREVGVAASVDVAAGTALDAPRAALVYRVAQEALRNVLKHAGAAHVGIRLSDGATGAHLEVIDDGRGFSEAEQASRRRAGHVGITLLPRLVADAGGALVVTSEERKGTKVALTLPRQTP